MCLKHYIWLQLEMLVVQICTAVPGASLLHFTGRKTDCCIKHKETSFFLHLYFVWECVVLYFVWERVVLYFLWECVLPHWVGNCVAPAAFLCRCLSALCPARAHTHTPAAETRPPTPAAHTPNEGTIWEERTGRWVRHTQIYMNRYALWE